MNNTNELLFQILLAIVGILIGLLPATLSPQSRRTKILLGIISYLFVAVAFFWIGYRYQQRPQYQVTNQLAQSIDIYANDDYQGSVGPGKSEVFSRYSFQDFPLSIRWEIKKYYSFGDDIGETIKKVDNGQTIIVDNQVGAKTFFHPVITSKIGYDCRISINDGTDDEAKGGIIRANSSNITPGYFILRKDSNVTLYCNNKPLWYGIRNGKDSNNNANDFSDNLQAGNGDLPLLFFVP